MRAVDVRVEGGKLVVERVADEALGGKMVALVWLDILHHAVEAGVAFEGSGVEYQAVPDLPNAGEPMVGVFEGHPTYDSMDFIPPGEQAFGEIRTVLARNSCNQSTFRGHMEIMVAAHAPIGALAAAVPLRQIRYRQ
jgi:hypothetical protein